MAYEYKVDIAGTTYGMNDIQSAEIEQPLFEKVSVGNTCNAKLTLVIWALGDIPRMAQIIPYCREEGTEEWTQLGVFFISTRREIEDKLEIVAYDCMLKSENPWVPDQSLEFPMTMGAAAAEIARLMGTELDERCSFNDSYFVDYPANEYAMRDILEFIATAHAGNWIVTGEGKLLLVPLYGMPPETNYLVNERGRAITFAGVKIIV